MHVLADVIGRIQSRQGCAVFVPDALGLNVSTIQYELLPCAALEQAQRMQAAWPEPIRFNVAGLVSEYEGKPVLLLQRVTRSYNVGNFGG